MDIEYTTGPAQPGYHNTYTLLGGWGEYGYKLTADDIDMLSAIGYNMIFLPCF